MATKTDTEVVIDGKVLTLSGYESEEYLQRVGAYINNKISEYNKVESFRRQPYDRQATLLHINIADDFFKARTRIDELDEEVKTKDKELYEIKHKLVASEMKLESMEKNLRSLQKELDESGKKIIRLELEAGQRS